MAKRSQKSQQESVQQESDIINYTGDIDLEESSMPMMAGNDDTNVVTTQDGIQEAVVEEAPAVKEMQEQETASVTDKSGKTDEPSLLDFDQVIDVLKGKEQKQPEQVADIEKTAETEETEMPSEQKPKAAQRDYSVFTEEEQKLFKGTSNEVYEYLKNILPKLRDIEKKYQELAAKGGDQQQTQTFKQTVYDHPNSYVLSPEYNNLVTKAQLYDFEERHWSEQLQRLRAGETKLIDLIGYNDDGTPKFAEIEIKPEQTAKAEVLLIKNIQAALGEKNKAISELNEFASKHKERYTSAINKIKAMEERYLSMYNEKSPRYKDMQAFIKNMPEEFKDNPLLMPMAKMYAMILDLIDIAKKRAEAEQKDKSIKRTSPSVSELRPNSSTDTIVYSPDEYEEEIKL